MPEKLSEAEATKTGLPDAVPERKSSGRQLVRQVHGNWLWTDKKNRPGILRNTIAILSIPSSHEILLAQSQKGHPTSCPLTVPN
jgi:hypothetical protein